MICGASLKILGTRFMVFDLKNGNIGWHKQNLDPMSLLPPPPPTFHSFTHFQM